MGLLTFEGSRCGWGSGTIYLAEKLPKSQIVGFSNSKRQKAYILAEAERRGLNNVDVITGDAATFEFERESFDRVMTIEVSRRASGGVMGGVPILTGRGKRCLST